MSFMKQITKFSSRQYFLLYGSLLYTSFLGLPLHVYLHMYIYIVHVCCVYTLNCGCTCILYVHCTCTSTLPMCYRGHHVCYYGYHMCSDYIIVHVQYIRFIYSPDDPAHTSCMSVSWSDTSFKQCVYWC